MGVLEKDIELQEETNPLEWLSLYHDFTDRTRFAGDQNIGHIINVALMYPIPEKSDLNDGKLTGIDGSSTTNEEQFDITDERGFPTGKTVSRSKAHDEGILHRTAHTWIVRKNDDSYQVLLQKRSANKDSFPSMYDTSSAGHIPAGDTPLETAARELKEELGIEVQQDCEFKLIGKFRIKYEKEFHGKMFRDNEVAFFIILFILILGKNLLKNPYVEAAMQGLKSCVTGVILATGVYMIIDNCYLKMKGQMNMTAILVTCGLSVIYFGSKKISKKGLSPIGLICVAAVVGVVVYGISNR